MGCWNGTCGITQLPIIHDQPVVAFLLVQIPSSWNKTHNGFCYSDELWAPISTPIYGTYNDYGSIEFNENDWNVKYITEKIKNLAIPKEEGNNPYHDLVVDPKSLNFESILKLIEKNRLFIKRHSYMNAGAEAAVGLMLVHQFAFDKLTSDYHDFRSIKLIELIESGHKWVKNASMADDYFDLTFGHYYKLLNGDSYSDRLFNSLRDSNESSSLSRDINVATYLEFLFKNAKENTQYVDDIILEISKMYLFRMNMSRTRKFFSPQTGAGSQDSDFDFYIELFEECIKYSKNMKDYFES